MSTPEPFYIVDAVGFLFRSYYAITPMTNLKGASTHALFGFIRSMQKLIKELNAHNLVAVFDGPDNSESRTKIYADYKGHRESMPLDLVSQIDAALEFCKLYGISTLQVPGIEADDTIGTITKWLESSGDTVYICSSDKDLCQLVSDHVFVVHAHKENLVIDKTKVEELFGVTPSQIVDLLSLMGDASDNIPGVPGFGPKTATKLLKEYGSLEQLFNNLPKLSAKQKETLEQHKNDAFISKQLASLDFSVSIPHDKLFYKIKAPDIENLISFYKEMNFMTLLKEAALSSEKTSQPDVKYEAITSQEALESLVKKLSHYHEIAIDTETTDIHPMKAELVGIGLCVENGHAYYIPTNQGLFTSHVLAILKPLLEAPNITFIGHNIKYDLHVLAHYGIELKKSPFDTMVASYLLNPQSPKHGLDKVTLEQFGKVKIPIEDLIGPKKAAKSMKDVPLDQITHYCCEDVDYTFRLKELFQKELKEKDLEKVFYSIEMPLVPVLMSMERHGIHVDKEKLKEMAHYLHGRIAELEHTIFSITQEKFNLNSPKQLSHILYEKLQIPTTTTSTSADVLEELQEKYPICRHILAYRMLEKLRSTYVESLPEQILPSTNKIHCSFNQTGTATGRLACQDPNLQNIPIRSEEGKKIRYAFKPSSPHSSFIAADYSQIELRILAHLSQDPTLMKAFTEGEDVHIATAAAVFNVPVAEVTSEMRQLAKAVNFGIIYGQQAFGLSKQLGISVQEASKFINTYFEKYPNIKSFLEECKKKARDTGVATTFTGRKRPLIDIHSKNPALKAAAERLAVNTPIQGSQADIIKLAMIAIHNQLKTKGNIGWMVLQIHDELIFEVPDAAIEEAISLIKGLMENIISLSVPLTVDVAIGKNWGEC